jgi:hypothetical protein
VVLAFFATLVPLRTTPGPLNELGEDLAFSAFAAVFWPFLLLVVLISPLRK